MARTGLIDVDSHNFPNLALMKLSAWHKARGDEVEMWLGLESYDRVYKAKVFSFTPDIMSAIQADEVIEGGTGYGNDSALPDDVEHTFPDYSLYGITDTAYGFLSRGCPRKCPYCIVNEKEGAESRKVADLREFWNGQRIIKLLDPNLLAAPEADALLQQLVASKAYIDFTQGLDIRLLDAARAAIIRQMKVSIIHFAWDDPRQDLTTAFKNAKKWLKYNERKLSVYVLTNYNSTHDEDLYRVETLRRIGLNPYIMIYDKDNAPRVTRLLQRYVNNKIIFGSVKRFEDYDPKRG